MAARLPLKQGFVLNGYTVQEVLGGGGFSLVYLAIQELSREKFVIKEYCPQDVVTRQPDGSIKIDSPLSTTAYNDGLKGFLLEAKALSQVKHDNMAHVIDSFRANETYYIVMAYETGRDLSWFIRKLAGSLDMAFLNKVFPKIGDGLSQFHQKNMLHMDIKPANILLRSNGEPLLLDFGAAKPQDSEDRFRSFQTLTHGFAPPEQYLDGALGPWTDIYSFAATLYACITGKSPPPALKRREGTALAPLSVDYAGRFPYPLLSAVESALQLDPKARPDDMNQLLAQAFKGNTP